MTQAEQTETIDKTPDDEIQSWLDSTATCRCQACCVLRAANAVPATVPEAREYIRRYRKEQMG